MTLTQRKKKGALVSQSALQNKIVALQQMLLGSSLGLDLGGLGLDDLSGLLDLSLGSELLGGNADENETSALISRYSEMATVWAPATLMAYRARRACGRCPYRAEP